MKINRIGIMLALALLVCLFPAAALAGDEPVTLESSSIQDGQTEVPLDTEIVLNFSNNVVNASVAENNANSIKLMQNGQETAVDIIMADDQVQPDQKRIIKVKPKDSLQKGQKYELVISGELTGKNGNKIGTDTVISFVTEGAATYTWYIIGGAAILAAILALIIVRRKHGSKKES